MHNFVLTLWRSAAALIRISVVIGAIVGPSLADVTVRTVAELVNAVNSANGAGDKTILINDGVYDMRSQALYIAADGVTVSGASGNRNEVVLDSHYTQSGTSGVFHIASSNVTISDLTLRHQYYHAIHITASNRDISNVQIRNVHIIDPGEQAIKINADRVQDADFRVRNGLIRGCLIELTASGRTNLTNTAPCYTGGVDAHWAVSWKIQDNVIRGFWCSDGLSEHGIHMWNHSDNAIVERNQIINCDRGIGFGLGQDRGNLGGIIRNNMIYHGPNTGFSDVGIGLESTPNTQVYNNTVFHEHSYSAIEYRFSATTNVLIANNLTNRAITLRDGASGSVINNRVRAQASWFNNVPAGDLHFSGPIGSIVGQGIAISGLVDDFDKENRPQGGGYEIGADEIPSAAPRSGTSPIWILPLLLDD